MCMRSTLLAAACLALGLAPQYVDAQVQELRFGIGTMVSPEELAKFMAISADGRGLPNGSGNAKVGARVYSENCASCHGDHLEGNPAKGVGGDKLIGGRGSLATKTPLKTVESYWPYATTLFDYVKRAMPFSSPGSLSDDDVYSIVAYILSEAKVIQPTDTMSAATLPTVIMPNRSGFEPDPRPELQLYR
jgi:S-disulfanyl-L-cysteine oxidoreductase SoxD